MSGFVVEVIGGGVGLAVTLVVLFVVAAIWSALFPGDGKVVQEGGRSVFPVPLYLRATVGALGLLALAMGAFGISEGWWVGVVPFGIGGGVILLAVPGPIETDDSGIRRRTFWLLPFWESRLRWDEIDSVYEEIESAGRYGTYRTATVSAGPDRTIKFSWAHSGLGMFLDELERRGVPAFRVPSAG